MEHHFHLPTSFVKDVLQTKHVGSCSQVTSMPSSKNRSK